VVVRLFQEIPNFLFFLVAEDDLVFVENDLLESQ